MRKLLYVFIVLIASMALWSCTNSKNTALTRRIQAFKARYNTYYNATLAFKDGTLAQEEGNKDNCTEFIPVYMTANKGTVKMGKGNFDTSIEKCKKDIQLHSLTKRPKWTKKRAKTPKDKLWLSQKEFNTFLHNAWFLMGESQFRQGAYMEAASTFAYLQRLYFTKPNVVAKAKVMEAKCYAELEWFYNAEDLISRAKRDSFPEKYNFMLAKVEADLDLRQKRYESAISNINLALKKEKSGLEKSRMYFLLGQLYHKLGDNQQAYKCFTTVIKRNPPYELEFNARIARTEAISSGQAKKMVRKLRRMSKNPKNKEYLDQVFYAIGNIYIAEGDTLHAISAYEEGVEKATRSGIEKGVLLVHLGRLYWEKEKFVNAHKCYSQALGLFDKEHEDYKQIDERTKILEELLPSAKVVELQDSLQMLAQMDSVKRMAIIKKIIDDLKKKEKEEERKAAEAEQEKNNANKNKNQQANQNNQNNNKDGGIFYFYNPTTIEAGKKAFEQKWGKRKNADDWQRNNKTVLDEYNEDNMPDSVRAVRDSIQHVEDSIQHVQDSIADLNKGKKFSKAEKDSIKLAEYEQDPHRPEYYLKDIPFTEEKMAESNRLLVDGLFGSAIIYKDRMENMPLAERTFKRIMDLSPDFEKNNEVFYNLFQLYSRVERRDEAAIYKNRLIEEFPEDPYSILISDSLFEFKGKYGKQIEDSIYQETYNAFSASDYETVLKNNEYTAKEYPNGLNRARFLFFSALSRLELGDRTKFMNDMKEIVEKYPKSTVSEIAGLYIKGLKEGRLLASGKFDNGSIWDRRHGFADEDSIGGDSTFITEKNCDFVFCIAYERDSINENQLLFEIARYNFLNFAVRNFDISFEKGDGIDMMQVRTFLNYDEAFIYLNRLLNDKEMARKLEGLKLFIIAEDNLKKLMKGLSFADYFDFYDETFDRIGSLDFPEDMPSSLDEPTELPEPVEEEEEYDEDEGDNFIF